MDDMFRLAVEACPAAMVLVDAAGSILLVNEECERMFGYGRGRLVGAPVDILVPVAARRGHEARRRTFAGDPSKRRMGAGRDLRATRADGREFPVEIGLTPIAGVGVLAFVVDISERVEAEASIRRYTARLEQANENLGRFAYVASHDIQEPLRKISAFADMLKTALAAENGAEATYAAEVMAASARHARRLVQDVLTLAKLHEASLSRRRVRVEELVADVLGDLSQAIAESGAAIEVAVGDIEIDCDPIQAERLLTNIVSNALKYHKPNEVPSISLGAAREGGEIRLTVADDGIGFAPRHATEIFSPFRRLHGRAAHPGTGIGLAIAKAIADLHGWTIEADAAEMCGATFTIHIPEG